MLNPVALIDVIPELTVLQWKCSTGINRDEACSGTDTMKSYQFTALSKAISSVERQSLLAQSNAVLTTPNCF